MARPLIIYRPLPGQERGNAEYLAQHKAAVIVDGPAELNAWLTHLLSDKDARAAMIGAQRAIRRPRATLDIARGCLELVKGLAAPAGGYTALCSNFYHTECYIIRVTGDQFGYIIGRPPPHYLAVCL